MTFSSSMPNGRSLAASAIRQIAHLMRQFERDFPYTETEDQLLAIGATKEDMISEKPMDRLICGDVGYGKTEVAMRAAFKAAVDGGKQVAVLVPTTVLAMQHFETFSERMSGFPVQVGVVSRFRSPKEVRETLEKTAKRRDRHPDRHPPAPFSRRQLQRSRPDHHRRRATIRRARQRTPEKIQSGRRLPDPLGHTDSSHALHVARSCARYVGHQYPAARPPSHQVDHRRNRP